MGMLITRPREKFYYEREIIDLLKDLQHLTPFFSIEEINIAIWNYDIAIFFENVLF